MKEAIRRFARELGFDDCGFTSAAAPESALRLNEWLARGEHGQMRWLQKNADKRTDPQRVLPGAKSIVALSISYAHTDPETTGSSGGSGLGIVARYARHRDYHHVLRKPLEALSNFISRLGGAGTRSLWYVDTGPVLERDVSQRAGLGFIGKHTNLVSRTLGNWNLLAEILTTLELEPDEPEKNRCGSCTRCIAACPTGAIKAAFRLDARLCISYLTIELKGPIPAELRPAIGNRIYGCDDCLAACPWNRFAREGRLMKVAARGDLAQPDLVQLLLLDEREFNRRFAGTPMLRTKRRGLLRNVCVALGNTGAQSSLPALQKAANDPEPLIAEHAYWAIQRIRARFAPR
jgi:epoxyqueuosine reductase